MKRGQLIIALVAAAAVAVVALLAGRGGDDGSQEAGEPEAPAGAVAIPFAYSPEKEKLLEPLIRDFNAQDGRAFVEVRSCRAVRPRRASPRAA